MAAKKTKKSNKKILLLAALGLVGVIGGTVGGTYAWLIASRTASGTIDNTGITATGDLKVKLKTESSYGSTISFSTGTLTDISGDGKTMYRPIFSQANDGTVSINHVNKITVAEGKNEGLVFQQTIDFQSDLPLAIYFDKGTTITANRTSEEETAKKDIYRSFRVAAIENATTKAVLHNSFISGETENAEDLKYVYTDVLAADTDVNYGLQSQAFDSAITVLDTDSITVRRTTTEDTDINAATNPELCTLSTTDNKIYNASIKLVFWFEGNDSHCVTDQLVADLASVVSTNLNFYALNPADNYTI